MKTELIMVEREQTRRALGEGEQRFKKLLAATTDYIYTVQVEGGTARSTAHRPGCEGVTGYTSAQFSADPYLWYRIVHQDDRELVLLQTQKILAGNGRPQPLEHRIVHKDGNIRWIRNTCIPHITDHGELVSYDGLITDITAETVAKQKLRESEERLQLIIEGSTDGVWDWDVNTGKTFFSRRWKNMLGYEDHELSNNFETWKGLIHPDDRDRAINQLEKSFSDKGEAYDLEHRLRHKDGCYRWILARGVVLRNARGDPVRMAGSHVDITERKRAAEELETMNRKLQARAKALRRLVGWLKLREDQLVQAARMEFVSILAGGVAHEIRNPLQTLLGGSDYLLGRFKNPDPGLEMVIADMRDAVRRADKIVRSIEPVNGVITCGAVDLNPIIEEALRLVRKDLTRCKIKVHREMDPGLPTVCVDADRICEVFINLILNAVHAMPDGGELTMRTWTVPRGADSDHPMIHDMAAISDIVIADVQDTGGGISPDDLPRVFELFWSKGAVGRGSGLGLPVTKRIVDLHHGAIAVTNSPLGGVVATVILPTANATGDWCNCEGSQQ